MKQENTPYVYAKAEWMSTDNNWYRACRVNLINVSGELIEDPAISFTVTDLTKISVYEGLDFTSQDPSTHTIIGRLADYKRKIPVAGEISFTIGVGGDGSDNWQLPKNFTVNKRSADIPRDHEKPGIPQNVRVTTTGSKTASLTWDAATDNIGIYSYQIEYKLQDNDAVTTVFTRTNSINLSKLQPS